MVCFVCCRPKVFPRLWSIVPTMTQNQDPTAAAPQQAQSPGTATAGVGMLTGPRHVYICMQLLACTQSGRGGRKGRSPAASEGLRSGAKLGLCLVWPLCLRWDRQRRARVPSPQPRTSACTHTGTLARCAHTGMPPCQAVGVTQLASLYPYTLRSLMPWPSSGSAAVGARDCGELGTPRVSRYHCSPCASSHPRQGTWNPQASSLAPCFKVTYGFVLHPSCLPHAILGGLPHLQCHTGATCPSCQHRPPLICPVGSGTPYSA